MEPGFITGTETERRISVPWDYCFRNNPYWMVAQDKATPLSLLPFINHYPNSERSHTSRKVTPFKVEYLCVLDRNSDSHQTVPIVHHATEPYPMKHGNQYHPFYTFAADSTKTTDLVAATKSDTVTAYAKRVSSPTPKKTGKRMRTTFTGYQLTQLEREFKNQAYIGGSQRLELSKTLGLSEAQVKVWWQNRRIKDRKLMLQPTTTKLNRELVHSIFSSVPNCQNQRIC